MRISSPGLVASMMLAWSVACGCGEHARLPELAGYGPSPALPPPNETCIPTTAVCKAVGWPAGASPRPAPGTSVTAFATGLQHPRWIHVLPNGDVLVAETDAPPQPEDGKGLRGAVQNVLMKRAGSGLGSADRITLLRDADGDGIAETKSVFLEGLSSPFGMELVGEDFYVANTDAVVRFRYAEGDTSIRSAGVRLVDLPAGPLNHHWTKNLIASRDGRRLYVTVGSNSNVAENGLAAEKGRAAIWEIDVATGRHRLFASGLRNPNGLDWEPVTGALWTVVNERDEIGSDLVPDFMTVVEEGAFYGWPFSYFGHHVDERVKPPRPDLVAIARKPDYALGNHTASLGLVFTGSGPLAARFGDGVFIGQHGSWNRRPRSGYKVLFVRFEGGRPAGNPVDVLTGFIDDDGNAFGRPVGVAIDRRGGLLVADDVGDAVWRVTATPRG